MRKLAIIIGVVIVVIITMLCCAFVLNNNRGQNTTGTTTGTGEITTTTKIDIGSNQYIDSLTKIEINGTNDSFIITEPVKWKVPSGDGNMTVSFALAIPYTITVDGKDYNGRYILSSNSDSKAEDENPKYNVEVTNLTKDGKIKVSITKK